MNIHGISEDQQTIKIELIAKTVDEDEEVCLRCYFNQWGGCTKSFCTAEERKDGKNIIWVESK